AEPLGPYRRWSGAAARVMAGRVAFHLGGTRLGRWLHVWAHRADRADPEAAYYYGRAVLDRRGPLAAWRFLRGQGELDGAPGYLRPVGRALRGWAGGGPGASAAAGAGRARARALAPAEPWPWIERAALLEMEDRHEESLAAARRALELRPWYRPGVQSVA